ncbi:zinc finger and BTB domain-containing protein 44 isoform X1 [Gadus chalcogrammus]|uniref:zinc finger and BTB domain-containing protein 44 isoform X1 n=1 Tax=Gadus chalcogrammus TaxID=1042646 RepID=UPI0024C495C4|nr:zinc finger and BTB domain-containing protein 44 isoform X1 [Gadus chalcogrammus]XP_056468368.1 zinc finger and BTB domain-containing protein 44 isoform X1 [Gadus chalcogrammus]
MGVKTFTHSSPSHSQEMLDKLNALRSEGHLCDVTIRVQDKLFLAHKVVLACCSDFFRTKLVGRSEEEDKFVLDLHHVTVSGFTPLLEYAYTSTLSISTENIIDVLAAASYMQMFAVASTCSEFMKSSILWSSGNNGNNNLGADKLQESAPESASSNCVLTPLDGSLSPVSSDCSLMERNVPVCRESRRKRKTYGVAMASPESLLKCPTQLVATSPQIPHPSPSFSDSAAQPVESSLAFPWTFPFGMDRRFHSDKSKLPESPRGLDHATAASVSSVEAQVVGRRLSDFLTCESSKAGSSLMAVEEEDVRVKVERLSDEEAQEGSSQPVSASLSDQQTVPGSEQVQEELLISPQSSSIGSMDEGVSEALPSMQSTSNSRGEDDERLDGIQYPYHLYISPSARSGANGPDRPFQCPTCGVRFTRIQNLKQHMLIHSGIKPFQCDRCGKKFTRAYSLKMHRLKHEGKRCFRCQICSATFTSFGEYKHHMRVSRHIIRKPRIYECKTCGAMFTNSGNLIVHLRSLNHEASELANYFQSSDFLVPDYLSKVQEEEEAAAAVALGVQYQLEDPSPHLHHLNPIYPSNSTSPTTASGTAATSSCSSSIQLPVISQVSSSTQPCDGSPPGFLSHEPPQEPPGPPSPSIETDVDGGMVALVNGPAAGQGADGGGGVSMEELQQHAQAQELASMSVD